MHPSISSPSKATPGFQDQIETFLQTAMHGLSQESEAEAWPVETAHVGRPVELPSQSLWIAVLVCVLRQMRSQRAAWRLLASCGLWGLPCYDSVDETVYKR